NSWLEAEAELQWLMRSHSNDIPGGLPRLVFTLAGDGKNLITRGDILFPRLLPPDMEKWNFPTNVMDGWMGSMVAVRGIRPWLAASKIWHDLHLGPPPDQLCVWAVGNLQMQTYFGVPLHDASNVVYKLTDQILEKSPSWFTTNDLAGFRRAEKFNGLEWQGIPYLWPFIQSVETNGNEYVIGGLFINSPQYPVSTDMLQMFADRTNMVYYDWEFTGSRTEQWLYISQFIRTSFNRPQLPFESAGILWLKAIAPLLAESSTHIDRIAPNRLSFIRYSVIGFTGIELHLLADWLESPTFPKGFHTLP